MLKLIQKLVLIVEFVRKFVLYWIHTKRVQGVQDATLTIRAEIPVVRTNQSVVLVGDGKALGEWSVEKGVKMNDAEAPVWSARLKTAKRAFAYKFVIVDSSTGDVVAWQSGDNYYFDDKVADNEALVIDGLRPHFDKC